MKPTKELNELKNGITTTTRVGIAHLEKMKTQDFIKLMKIFDEDFKGILSKGVKISEKIDGLGLKFGLTSTGEFFMESSNSGPQISASAFSDYDLKTKGTVSETALGYSEMFRKIKSNKSLMNYMKTNFPNGVKIIGEMFYNGFGIQENGGITFVGVKYNASKLGKWGTFFPFAVQDVDGIDLPAQDVIKNLKDLSTKDFLFTTADLKNTKIDLKLEIAEFKKIIANQVEVLRVLNSRKKVDREQKLRLKEIIAAFQVKFAAKIISSVERTKFGFTSEDFEGVVIELNTNDKLKITSPVFKKYMTEKSKSMQDKVLISKNPLLKKKLKIGVMMGRLQPFTKVHENMVKSLLKRFEKVYLFVSDTGKTDKKNPWSFYERKELIERSINSTKLEIVAVKTGMMTVNINKNIPLLDRQKGINLFAGSDRVDAFSKQVMRSRLPIGVEELKRTDDDISATKIRNALKENDFKTYKKMIASKLDNLKTFEKLQGKL